jgi:transcriptional regulator with XRE-family HTH domain
MAEPRSSKTTSPGAIAVRVKALRKSRKFTLDMLAQKSGVSRAAISLIERGQSSPTAIILERLATGLGVTLASLFENGNPQTASDIARFDDVTWWQDPATGYQRRNVSPSGQPVQIVESLFPAGASITYETAAREPTVHEQIWVLDGEMEIKLGDTVHRLSTGDCLAFTLNQKVGFHNPGLKPARYAVVMASG